MMELVRIKKLCEQGRLHESLKILEHINQQGSHIPASAYTSILKECARTKSLLQGRCVHGLIVIYGNTSNIILENTLIDMYGKCGSLNDAKSTFDHMPKHNVFSWTAIITSYVKQSMPQRAFEMFSNMRTEGCMPDKFIFVIVLKACASMEAVKLGRHVHGDVFDCSTDLDLFLCSTLVDMYAKCKCVADARKVFDSMSEKDVVSWNAMISGYVQEGPQSEAIALFEKMKLSGVKQNELTLSFVVKACAILADLEHGEKLHKYIVRCGFAQNLFVGNSLLDMYTKCHSLTNVQKVFDAMQDRDVVSWTIIMSCHVQHGLTGEAILIFQEMHKYLVPSRDSYVIALNACARGELFETGRCLHSQMLEADMVLDAFLVSSLIDMYAKCGSIDDALHVFHTVPKQDVVSWNSVIGGCVQQGFYEKAFDLFTEMHAEGVPPGGITFASIIKASSSSVITDQGLHLHAYVVEQALQDDVFVGSSLVDMYSRRSMIKDAFQVFKKICKPDVVMWNTMLTAYVQQGLDEDAMALFESMKSQAAQISETTFTIVLKACTNLTVLEWGKLLHCQILKMGYESSLPVESALLDMYAKCGSAENARTMFDRMQKRDIIAWTAMITGYTLQGAIQEAESLFHQMHGDNAQPNEITFIGILYGYSHTGLITEAYLLFSSMIREYGMTPMIDHFACIIDLLSRAGLLAEAYSFLKEMPILAGEILWMSLLGACRIFGSLDIAEQAAEEVMNINPENSAAFVQLSNIYLSAPDTGRMSHKSHISADWNGL